MEEARVVERRAQLFFQRAASFIACNVTPREGKEKRDDDEENADPGQELE